jgi:hypothetical protein
MPFNVEKHSEAAPWDRHPEERALARVSNDGRERGFGISRAAGGSPLCGKRLWMTADFFAATYFKDCNGIVHDIVNVYLSRWSKPRLFCSCPVQ